MNECENHGWDHENEPCPYCVIEALKADVLALKKCDATGYDRFEAGKSFVNRKIEAEVKRLQTDNALLTEVIEPYAQINDLLGLMDSCQYVPLVKGLEAEVNRLRIGLTMLTVGSCNCLTKTDDIQYHQDYCIYKKIQTLLNPKETGN